MPKGAKDEYTLGKNDKLEILDSKYERDFDEKFLQNKHNFQQVNEIFIHEEPVASDEFYQMINS